MLFVVPKANLSWQSINFLLFCNAKANFSWHSFFCDPIEIRLWFDWYLKLCSSALKPKQEASDIKKERNLKKPKKMPIFNYPNCFINTRNRTSLNKGFQIKKKILKWTPIIHKFIFHSRAPSYKSDKLTKWSPSRNQICTQLAQLTASVAIIWPIVCITWN